MSDTPVDLASLQASADAACHDEFRSLLQALDAKVWEPAAEAVRAAGAAHAEAVEASGLASPCPEDPVVARERVTQYLVAVGEQVHRPFLEALAVCAPLSGVAEVFSGAARETEASCAGLPGGVRLPRESRDLTAVAADGVGRRTGRVLARVLSGVGLGGKERTVDARGVARRHCVLRLKAGQDRWQSEALRRWAVWVTDVEALWASWAGLLRTPRPGENGSEGETLSDLWRKVAEAAAVSDKGWKGLQESCPHAGMAAGLEEDVARWSALLQSDLSVAGTFLLNPKPIKDTDRRRSDTADWAEWQQEALARLQLHGALLSVFAVGHRACVELEGRLRGEALDLWRGDTRACADSLRALSAEVGKAPEITQAVLDRLLGEAESALVAAGASCPERAGLEALARRAAGLTIGAVQSGLRGVPATLVIHRLPPRPLRRPTETKYTLAVQEMARQSFDALRMERIRTAPSVIADTVDAMRGALSEVSDIVAFGFDAGGTELAGEAEDRLVRVRELVAEGLERAAAAVGEVPTPLAEATEAAAADVRQEIMRGVGGFASRALAHRVEGRLLDARTRLAGVLDDLHRRAGPGVQREVHRVRLVWLRLRRWVVRIFRRGQSLVGAEGGTVSAAARTARSLAAADELVASLPLVYQHLFTTDPVTDPALLAGRHTELAEVESRWDRWSEGKGIPLVVVGRRGSGVSSVFNVLMTRMKEKGADVLAHTLTDRLTTEAELSTFLSGLLGLEVVDSLDALAAEILNAPEGGVPDMVALDGLEHVYLRVPGGTDLLERLVTLMAETEPRIFWMASLTSSAWQIIRKAEPAAAVQLDALELAPLPVSHIQDAVMHRHRRSGMQLRFEEPAEGRRMLRRRLRGLRGTDRHQELLQADYFERLHRSAQGNLRLAFFQWLNSVDFGAADSGLVVHSPAAMDWSFLDPLDLTQNFTLKAFLEHQTLTLEEHDRIFRCTRQESYHILDSLVNRQIIEMVPEDDEESAPVSKVLDDARYRIRPLFTGAVAMHLASRNIVH